AAATCPLEVVKTRMQSSLYKNLPHSAVQNAKFHPLRAAYAHVSDVVFSLWTIKQREGLRGLWKGLGPNLVGVIPARAIYFSSYHTGKQMYTSLNGHRETPLVHMASAFTAGVATAVATNPIWLIKTRMQLQSERAGQARHYRNSFHCLRAVVKEEGIRGLYKGLSASFLGLSESTLQFVLYEQFKKTLLERKRRDQVMDPAQHLSASTVPKQLDWKDTFAAAASAKLIAAVFAYPHEVLRTRLRESPTTNGVTKYHGLVQSAKLIYIEEGVAGLYGGLTAHLMRVVPNAAIMFATVEFIIHYGSSL
ncbi:mitochondrial carrier domain-containing protein, partial [Zopfochytrium polystomum]